MQKPLLSDLPKYCLQIWELLLTLWFGDVHLREERRSNTYLDYRYGDKCGLRAPELTMSINTFNLGEGNICYQSGNTLHFACELFKMILM